MLLQLLFLGFVGIHSSSLSNSLDHPRQTGLGLIGEVGGKRFYAGHASNEVDWNEAKRLCETAGYKFASVETAEEEVFLKEALSARFEETDISHYWTSGRDRLSKLQYIWDSTGRELDHIGEVDFYGPLSCLTIAVPDYRELWDVRPCDDVWPTLCNSNGPENTTPKNNNTTSNSDKVFRALSYYILGLCVAVQFLCLNNYE